MQRLYIFIFWIQTSFDLEQAVSGWLNEFWICNLSGRYIANKRQLNVPKNPQRGWVGYNTVCGTSYSTNKKMNLKYPTVPELSPLL